MTYRGLFCLDHLYVVTLCIIFFWKVFCNNILYSLSLRPVTSTHFPDHLRTLAFQIIFWSPRYTMRLDIRHKIFANVMQNLTQDVAYFQKKNSLFFFYGFLSGALFLFVSFQMFWCTLVFTPTDSILKHENDVLKKMKLRKVYIY